MSEPDVSFNQVKKKYDDVTAVKNLDFEIETGKFLTLLGPSGCGKTTTLRCIAGFEKPTEGEVNISGHRANDLQPFERDTAMVFQSYALFPHMTVGENVAFGLQMNGIPSERPVTDGGTATAHDGFRSSVSRLIRRNNSDEVERRVTDALELVELPGMQNRSIGQLSGGQQQRVALARALVTEPTLLLLDEPLGALDRNLRQSMQIELKNLQEETGITFVYVTHDQEEALTMSDEIAVMNEGEVEQIGTATEIYEEPASEFVADFIGDTNIIHGSYTSSYNSATIESNGMEYQVPEAKEATGEVALAVRPEKIRVGDDTKTLENKFEAVVIDSVYRGNIGKYTVELENDYHLDLDVQITDREQFLSKDDSVVVGWERKNGVVLTR